MCKYKEIEISNNKITAVISTMGAELKSIKKDGREILWDGNSDIWSGQAPVLFPICGGLKDGFYNYNGKKYTLPKHGYAMNSEFETEAFDKTSATFLLRSNEETLKQYPFEYEFRVIFTLIDSSLNVDFSVINKGVNTMYYSVGAHESYYCPNGIEEYSVIFEKDEPHGRNLLCGNLLDYKTAPLPLNGCELPLKYDYFKSESIVITDINSKKVALKNNTTGDVIKIEYDCDNLLFWTIPNAHYICIEPWQGLPDYIDSDNDLSHKKGIITLAPGTEHTNTHTITF